MNASNLPLVESHHPMTFASRGVAAPFTTPLLAGTRVRESPREGVEIIAPNPSGGRGVYVLHWPGVRALCSPTVHDTLLFRRLCRLRRITPGRIRQAALEVAREGHAGRDAADAAEAALAHDRAQALFTHFLLVTGLVEQIDPGGRTIAATGDRRSDLDRRASAVLHRIAPSLGQPAAWLATSLTALGALLAPIGMEAADRGARVPLLLQRLRHAQADLSAWLRDDPGHDIGGLGQAVAGALQRACDSGSAALDRTRAGLGEPPALLTRWVRDRDSVLGQAARCDWLLDGWDRVALLWLSAASTAARRAALLEMAPLVPILPREVAAWTDLPIDADAMKQMCRVTSHDDAWRTGGPAFALIQRNEALIAASAQAGIPPEPAGRRHAA